MPDHSSRYNGLRWEYILRPFTNRVCCVRWNRLRWQSTSGFMSPWKSGCLRQRGHRINRLIAAGPNSTGLPANRLRGRMGRPGRQPAYCAWAEAGCSQSGSQGGGDFAALFCQRARQRSAIRRLVVMCRIQPFSKRTGRNLRSGPDEALGHEWEISVLGVTTFTAPIGHKSVARTRLPECLARGGTKACCASIRVLSGYSSRRASRLFFSSPSKPEAFSHASRTKPMPTASK